MPEGAKPQGKGPSAGADAVKSARACLVGRGIAPARGRQARLDLARAKSSTKNRDTVLLGGRQIGFFAVGLELPELGQGLKMQEPPSLRRTGGP